MQGDLKDLIFDNLSDDGINTMTNHLETIEKPEPFPGIKFAKLIENIYRKGTSKPLPRTQVGEFIAGKKKSI